jgi:predicted GNAT family acetyltransferase
VPPTISIADQPDSARYTIAVDNALAGFLTYQLEAGRIAFMHAEIDPAVEGQGLGSQLTAFALDDARARGLTVEPYCPFVRSFIERHDQYRELVPESRRGRFGL